jgi:hypothetical protein
MTEGHNSRRRLSWASAAVFIVLILAALGGFIFYRMETWPVRASRQVRDIFADVAHLQPKISVRDRVLFEQTASTLELAIASRETHVEREVKHDWLGSTKRLQLRGTYNVRAGFDLTQPFNVRITGRHVSVELPAPKILSVDQMSVEVAHFDNGLWNKFNPDEVVNEVRTLPVIAREKAVEAGLEKEALDRFTQKLRERLAPQYELDSISTSAEPAGAGAP